MAKFESALVLDNGANSIRIGLSDNENEEPTCVFDNVVGRPKHESFKSSIGDLVVGDKVDTFRNLVVQESPMEYGVISNFDDMDKIWYDTFENKFNEIQKELPLVMTECIRNPAMNRIKTAEMMFEAYQVPYFYLAPAGILSLFQAGFTTGLVFDSGLSCSQIIPIYEGYELQNNCRYNIGGKDITDYKKKLLNQQGNINFTTTTDRYYVDLMKKKFGYISLEIDLEPTSEPQDYELPDGLKVHLNSERYQAPEIMFQPDLIYGYNNSPTYYGNKPYEDNFGVQYIVNHIITSCDVDIRRDLYKNIFLAGGNSQFKGFQERLTKELQELSPDGTEVKVRRCGDSNSAWLGGAIVASMFTKNMFISKEEYDENGAESMFKRKCIQWV